MATSIGGVLNSDINLNLPAITAVNEPADVANDLQSMLNAFRVIQQELSAAKRRIDSLEAYNIAHP